LVPLPSKLNGGNGCAVDFSIVAFVAALAASTKPAISLSLFCLEM
jgi:hypothetical protein